MQFDLLTSECIQAYKLTKEGFIAANRKLDVEGSREVPVRLKVDRVSRINKVLEKDTYIIVFRGKFRYRDRVVEDELYVSATWENGDWFICAQHVEI